MKVNWDDEIPKIWEKKKCSKPPTSDCRSGRASRPPWVSDGGRAEGSEVGMKPLEKEVLGAGKRLHNYGKPP